MTVFDKSFCDWKSKAEVDDFKIDFSWKSFQFKITGVRNQDLIHGFSKEEEDRVPFLAIIFSSKNAQDFKLAKTSLPSKTFNSVWKGKKFSRKKGNFLILSKNVHHGKLVPASIVASWLPCRGRHTHISYNTKGSSCHSAHDRLVVIEMFHHRIEILHFQINLVAGPE